MFDRDELELVRRNLERTRRFVTEEDSPVRTQEGTRFAVAFAGATAFLIFLLVIVWSTGLTVAVGFGQVGGFQVSSQKLIGNEMSMYPTMAETSACRKTVPKGVNVPGPKDEYLAALQADIANARVPATEGITVTKDIVLPDAIPTLDNVRIALSRRINPSNPDYPPSASPIGYPLSNGDSPLKYLDWVEYSGLVSGLTGDNDGYSNRTNFRTRENVTPGGDPKRFNVIGHGFYDFSPVDAGEYTAAIGSDDRRYIDDVYDLGTLSNTGTGSDGGYADFTSQDTGNLTRGSSNTLSVDAVGALPDYGDAPASQYADTTAENTSSYIGDVDLTAATIPATNQFNGDGYSNFTGNHTDNMTRGNTYTMTVDYHRRDFTYTSADPTFWGGTYPDTGVSGESCGWGCDDEFEIMNVTVWKGSGNLSRGQQQPGGLSNQACYHTCGANNDDDGWIEGHRAYDDYTCEPGTGCPADNDDETISDDLHDDNVTNALIPGETYNLSVWYDAEEDPDQYVKAWIDWDRDGDMNETKNGERITVGAWQGNSQVGVWNHTSFTVPGSAHRGTTILRVVSAQNQSGGGRWNGPFWDQGADGGYQGQKEDYSFHIGETSHVRAFIDWNHDKRFQQNEIFQVARWHNLRDSQKNDLDRQASTDIRVPQTAISGSTLMRVTMAQQQAPPSPSGTNLDGEIEDYTAEVTQDMHSIVRAWVDWDQDGELDNTLFSSGGEAYQLMNSTTDHTGEFTASGSIDVPTGAPPPSGSTLLRVMYEQGQVTPEPDQRFFYGETEDYTLHLNATSSFIRAWIDWDGDGDVSEAGELLFTREVTPTANLGEFEITEDASIPSSGPVDGAHLMRVTHKQGMSAPAFGEGVGGWFGETEDYTAIVGPNTTQPDWAENITLGEASMTFTSLQASDISGRGGIFIDEDFSDNTKEDPIFGPDGEFTFASEVAIIDDLEARAHLLVFNILRFPNSKVNITYNVPSSEVRAKAQTNCTV